MTSRLEAWFRDNEPDDTIVPAATVVLVRDGDTGLETLMLHKNSKLAFGGMWVFPGGRIDVEDSEGAASAEDAARRASVRDFHSFRVSWVTVALTAGVPLEIVQRVTGHRTTDIVLKHYFQPGKEDFRRTLAGKLPALLGDHTQRAADEFNLADLRAKLTAMEDSTWRHIRDELLSRLPAEKNVTPLPALSKSSFAA